MPTIDRAGARIYYEMSGTGPPLLLGHSLLVDGRMWDAVVPGLAHHFRVINVDARGHRHSTAAGAFTLDDLAADWLAIMDQEKIDCALLCGLSMGGMTAMRLALQAPDRVAALALLDTSADEEPPAQRRAYRLLAEIWRVIPIDFLVLPIVERKMFGRTARRDQRDVVERGLAIVKDQEPRALYPAARAVFERESISTRIWAIRSPTLVLCGEEDVSTPPSRSRRIAERVPGASLHLIPRAGHVSAMEQPAEVETRLVDFLTRHAALAA